MRHGQYDLESEEHGLTELGVRQSEKLGQRLAEDPWETKQVLISFVSQGFLLFLFLMKLDHFVFDDLNIFESVGLCWTSW